MNGLEQIYGDRVVFQRMNADEPDGRAALKAYKAPGHPTVVLIDAQGNVVWMRTGVLPESAYAEGIETLLQVSP
ncbi:MAG TPA: hypothetical protein ENK60_09425 [Anaerolineae bacterium]|nr:hypothetical protein [Anaerolineae bacterium]